MGPRNPYDAFAMTGIGRGGNGVFRSRKIKNNKKRREFYITGEVAGAVLSEKSEPEFEVKPVTEPYKKKTPDKNTDKDNQPNKHYTIPIEKQKDEQQVDSLEIEDQESEKIVREILAPYQED